MVQRFLISPALALALAAGFVATLAGGCSSQPETTATKPSPLATNTPQRAPTTSELIPRDVLFGNPERSQLRISPDGKTLSWIAPRDGVLNVWTAPVSDPKNAKPLTSDKSRGIRQYQWAYNSTHVLYVQDLGGDENWKIYSVDVASGAAKDLTPFEEIKDKDGKAIMQPNGKPLRPAARIDNASEKFPDEILIGLNNRDPQYHDLYRCNIKTGALKMVQQNDAYEGFITDEDFNVRFAAKPLPDGGTEILKANDKGGFETFQTIPQGDSLTSAPLGFDHAGKTLYMTDSRGRDTGALFAVDPATGEKKLLAENAKADAGATITDPKTGVVQAVAFEYEREHWTVLDTSIQPDLDYLKSVANGEVSISSRTLDDTKWTVAYVLDNGPVRYYLYDRPAKKATFLFTNQPKLEGLALAHTNPVVIKSRDGLDLVSYLTLPAGSDKDNNARPDAGAIPMVLFVHGGPWARDNWGYNPYAQWLSNRGYAVLEVNYRGSTGFGKKFVAAGDKEWAGKMHDDLIDAVNWAVDQKIAKKDKVAIMGGSYGGYATLVGLTFTPDTFACGVDIVGPSNLVTLLNTIPPYWAPAIAQFTTRVGDHRTEDGKKFLLSRSPLTLADKIRKPLLIGQGANDPRVKQAEADQIVKAMQSKNIPVTYVLFPDEGHGFARPQNRTAFNAVTEQFLAANLGGQAQPIGSDFEGSSITVPQGAELVSGVGATLGTPKK
jgi:dipeptidyl aminopeptidase/acylaminoacyl peptidase